MTKLLIGLLALLGAATALAQQPDCRTVDGPVGAECIFTGTQLPVQRYLGDITLPSSERVHVTGPIVSMIAPAAHGPGIFTGLLGGVQTETMGGFSSGILRTEGVQAYARMTLSPSWGIDLRGTSIAIGGSNHTESIQAGPRLEHGFGPVCVYGEALAGAGYQYAWGLPVSGVVGMAIRIPGTQFAVVPFDGTYTYAAAQHSSRNENPQKGRIEAFAGLEYHLGRRS